MAKVHSVNHSAICVHDLHAAELFYCGLLGAVPESNVDYITEDVLKGRSQHLTIVFHDYLIALMLAHDFMPMPADEQLRGFHGFRHAFSVPRREFGDIQAKLKAAGVPFEGPTEHPVDGPFGESIYFKDPCGNFLEFLWRRDEAERYERVQGFDEWNTSHG